MYPGWLPIWSRWWIYALFCTLIFAKWLLDRSALPLKSSDWGLYLDIHVASILRLHRLPNLRDPKGFNDQMKWLMLFDQHPLMRECADKYEVRRYVAGAIGLEYLIPLRAHGHQWGDVKSAVRDGAGVIKCSHDSGSARIFDNLSEDEASELEHRFTRLLEKSHGVGKGEWHYGGYTPQLLVEEKLPGTRPGCGPADIKVHCVEGEPRLIHIIEGRQSQDQRHAFFLPNGQKVALRVKAHREDLDVPDIESIVLQVLPLARKLAQPFRYVRTDFYRVENSVFFGELSFHEEAGLFRKRDEERDLARFLEIPCTGPRPTLHSNPLSTQR
jgi:hypothetical protein